jgi:hypothetical protein
MKISLSVVSILMALFLVSCQEKEENTEASVVQDVQEVQTAQVQSQTLATVDIHTVQVQEVIQGQSYTYLKVKEEGTLFWVAISKSEMEVGETIAFKNPLEMRNFTSKELTRTFEVIYFVGRIEKESPSSVGEETPHSHQPKPVVETKAVSIEPVEGGVSIGELFSNREAYAGKVVRVKGQVTKVNLSIMGKNWVHLQDGTGEPGSNDLLVTTQDKVALGDTVTFEGTIALNRDFGSGYAYELLMEEAKL